ncbi:hypothetical protein CVT26_015313 [Gymnopilus dilepis]|uniref:F-box domain-containing protein n=1 Tax=Gymnopilus dilepis TaxID=231916 RepID=A0A409W4B8_9AGAR|nr:hypothetical protein CVT26_015313 [Gymnopilus dilepis]
MSTSGIPDDDPRPSSNDTSITDRLPPEILSDIFICYVASHLSQTESPLKLGAICQRWRQIAWTRPDLWATLMFQTSRPGRSVRCIDLAIEWIRRSARLPLSITLEISGFNYVPNPERDRAILDFTHLLDVINAHGDRWHSLNLNLPGVLLSNLNGWAATGSSTFHTLVLRSCDEHPVTFTNIFNITPRVVEFDRIPLRSLGFNWKYITQLKGHFPSTDEIFEVLRKAPALRHCTFRLSEGREWPQGAAPELVHPSIRSLELVSWRSVYPQERFFRHVTLPALDTFILTDIENKFTFPLGDCQRFLSRSTTGIKTLKVVRCGLSPERLYGICSVVPSLENLVIEREMGEQDPPLDPFYAALGTGSPSPLDGYASPPISGPILPLLREFHWLGTGGFPWHLLSGLLASVVERQIISRPMKCIKIHCRRQSRAKPIPFIEPDVLERLSEYKKETNFDFTVELQKGVRDLWAMSEKKAEQRDKGGELRSFLVL